VYCRGGLPAINVEIACLIAEEAHLRLYCNARTPSFIVVGGKLKTCAHFMFSAILILMKVFLMKRVRSTQYHGVLAKNVFQIEYHIYIFGPRATETQCHAKLDSHIARNTLNIQSREKVPQQRWLQWG
jgi:hypothetical protein